VEMLARSSFGYSRWSEEQIPRRWLGMTLICSEKFLSRHTICQARREADHTSIDPDKLGCYT